MLRKCQSLPQVFVIVLLVFSPYFGLLEYLSSPNTEIGRWLVVDELPALGGRPPAAGRIPRVTPCFMIPLCSPRTDSHSLSPPSFMSLLPLLSKSESLSNRLRLKFTIDVTQHLCGPSGYRCAFCAGFGLSGPVCPVCCWDRPPLFLKSHQVHTLKCAVHFCTLGDWFEALNLEKCTQN